MSLGFDQAIKDNFRYSVFLLKVVHPDTTISYLNTGYRNIDWDDGAGLQTWKGAGGAIDLTLPDQTSSLEVTEFKLTLSGIASEYQWMASEKVRGLQIVVSLGFVGEDGNILGAEIIEDGLQDRVEWNEGEGGEQSISLICQGGVAFLTNQSVGRWSPEPHNDYLTSLGLDPESDTGFDRQAGIPDDAEKAAWWAPE